MKETNIVLCKCSEDVFLELVQSEQVFGHPDEFVMHIADFCSLSDDMKQEIEHEYLYKK